MHTCTSPGFELLYISKKYVLVIVKRTLLTPHRNFRNRPRSNMFVAFLAPLGDISNNAETLDRRRGAFFGALVADALCLGSHYGNVRPCCAAHAAAAAADIFVRVL